jgi:hypothetical protein
MFLLQSSVDVDVTVKELMAAAIVKPADELISGESLLCLSNSDYAKSIACPALLHAIVPIN